MLPNDTTAETWLPVVGYAGIYSISNCGRVRRDARGPHTQVGRILKPALDRYGYLIIGLRDGTRRRQFTVHKLVAAAFLGPRPISYGINHKNGIKTNNVPSNLEYMTSGDNTRHASRLGLMPHGATHPFVRNPELSARGVRCRRAKLTDDAVREMRSLHAVGWSVQSLMARFNVSNPTVYRVLRGAAWKHVV